MKGGGCKGGELPFIYKTLDLDCVETVCFKFYLSTTIAI